MTSWRRAMEEEVENEAEEVEKEAEEGVRE
jgi:hypothetical protein